MKKIILIPVLNEKNNITRILKKIRKYYYSDIVYINDNSTDGTTEEIDLLSKKYKNIFHINRKNKSGIGSAHKDGIKWCYRKNYDLIITMDGDGTHDPKYFKQMISNSKKFDYVITSRFKKPNLLKDWPLSRKILTYSRHFIVKFFLGINFDASGAYRCFSVKKIRLQHILSSKNNDYAFFWELTYNLHKKGYSIFEIPVELVFRKLGKSKMRLKHIINSLFYLFKIYTK